MKAWSADYRYRLRKAIERDEALITALNDVWNDLRRAYREGSEDDLRQARERLETVCRKAGYWEDEV